MRRINFFLLNIVLEFTDLLYPYKGKRWQMADLEVSEPVCYCNSVCIEEDTPFLKCQVCEKKFHIGELLVCRFCSQS